MSLSSLATKHCHRPHAPIPHIYYITRSFSFPFQTSEFKGKNMPLIIKFELKIKIKINKNRGDERLLCTRQTPYFPIKITEILTAFKSRFEFFDNFGDLRKYSLGRFYATFEQMWVADGSKEVYIAFYIRDTYFDDSNYCSSVEKKYNIGFLTTVTIRYKLHFFLIFNLYV